VGVKRNDKDFFNSNKGLDRKLSEVFHKIKSHENLFDVLDKKQEEDRKLRTVKLNSQMKSNELKKSLNSTLFSTIKNNQSNRYNSSSKNNKK